MGKVVRYRRRGMRSPFPAAIAGVFAAGIAGTVLFVDPPAARTPAVFRAGEPAVPRGTVLEGRASVIDGDTLDLQGRRVRLAGIDAPEGSQRCTDAAGANYRCGREAADALDAFLAESRPVRCVVNDVDQYGRDVADCARADGSSVQAFMVHRGWALDYPEFSGGAYAPQQAAAQNAGRGLWQGAFEPPRDVREAARSGGDAGRDVVAVAAPAPAPVRDCRIKGNINDRGERIFHMPGQQYYDVTRISGGRGERWFCTTAEARAAGWRASRV